MAQERTGAGHVEHWVRIQGQRGITHFLEFLEKNQTRTSYFLKRKETFIQQEHQWKRLSPGKSRPVCLISLVKAHGTKSPCWHRKRGREHVAGAQTRESPGSPEASFLVSCMQRISTCGLSPLNTTQKLHEKLSQRTTSDVKTKPGNVQWKHMGLTPTNVS